jgi:hypothetical protein
MYSNGNVVQKGGDILRGMIANACLKAWTTGPGHISHFLSATTHPFRTYIPVIIASN